MQAFGRLDTSAMYAFNPGIESNSLDVAIMAERNHFVFRHTTLENSACYEWDNISVYGGVDIHRPQSVMLYFAGIDDEIEMEIRDETTLHKLIKVLMDNQAILKRKREKKSRGDLN